MRSIPEKTLEHWTSIYLSNRFPNGAMWWPTSGEDVLAELPQLAASGPGKTLALELKTTEATGSDHVLWIDTHQLDRYLNPPFGPPLPVYYVFPAPHWDGPLTSRSGTTPTAPKPTTAPPPEWWRRRAGRPWFGDWLYVMSAQSVSAALPPAWRTSPYTKTKLFKLNASHIASGGPDWGRLFTQLPKATPMRWTSFWTVVTQCGPHDGVRWRTVTSQGGTTNRVLVLDGSKERVWQLNQLFDRPSMGLTRPHVEENADDNSAERVLLHIPDSALT